MAAGGAFAFAPLGASPSVAGASEMVETTTEQGLITPKADDPVIYTTESGLEIKWGNALPSSAHNNLSSGNLKWFPYFTTTNGSTTYTWVIIGRNPNLSLDSYTSINQIFSTWKTNSTYFTNGSYFFNNTYETATPAGSAINGIVPSKSYVADYSNMVVPNEEIPSGCVLSLSNTSVTQTAYYASNSYLNSYESCFNGSTNTLRQVCANYYTNDTFGFGTHLSTIQLTTVHQMNQIWINNAWVREVPNSTNLHFFPLTFKKFSNENFTFETYLTDQQYSANDGHHMLGRSSSFYSSSNTYQSPCVYDATTKAKFVGTGSQHYMNNSNNWYCRPACVIKLV